MANNFPTELVEHDIHPEDTLVFLHIAKAGGITLGTLIDPMWLPGARCPEYMTLPLARLPRPQIARYRSFIGHFNYSALTQLLPGEFKSITMLRHPFSRQLSFLRMLKRLGESAADGTIPSVLVQIGNPFFRQIFEQAIRQGGEQTLHAWRKKPLEALVEDEELQKNFNMLNGQTLQITPLRLVAGQLPGQPGLSEQEVEAALLESARENLARMPGFGLLERFQDSLYLLSFLFGWRPLPDSLHLNEAPQTLDPNKLSPVLLTRLEKYNELDLQLYDFASVLFEQRFQQMTLTLLERYGEREHAHLKPPLPAEVLETLLDRHYRERLLQRTPPAGEKATSTRFTFDQAVSGAFGWQHLENSPGHELFRWTGPGRESSIDLLPLRGGDIQLQVGICNAVKPCLLENITITVNDKPLPCVRSSTGGTTCLQLTVPHTVIQDTPYLRLNIRVPDTFAPNTLDPENPDSRLLGVAVFQVNQEIIPHEEKP